MTHRRLVSSSALGIDSIDGRPEVSSAVGNCDLVLANRILLVDRHAWLIDAVRTNGRLRAIGHGGSASAAAQNVDYFTVVHSSSAVHRSISRTTARRRLGVTGHWNHGPQVCVIHAVNTGEFRCKRR
jgi:hypothetical protein